MTNSELRAQPSLVTTLCVNIGQVAVATLLILSILVFGANYVDYDNVYLDHVGYEARALLAGVENAPDGLSFALPQRAGHYDGKREAAYGFRVLDGTGRVIAAKNASLLEAISPWSPDGAGKTDFWFVKLPDPGHLSPHFAGGKKFRVNDADVLIETATFGDPAGIRYWVLLHQTADDVWLPILPLLFLIPLVTIVSIRRALVPLAGAAQQAATINPENPGQGLDLAGMPREASAFASAINGLIGRVGALVQSQKIFVLNAAHELRTPLAVMTLELENIDHPCARRLEKDVVGMLDGVNRLLVLAQLEKEHASALVYLDLGTIAVETIDRIQSWANARNHEVDLRLKGHAAFRGDPVAIREALRNLLENAVKHTPAGTTIVVTVGPERTIMVEDSGPGLPSVNSDRLFEPFAKGSPKTAGFGLGLAIVKRAVELHGGSVRVRRSPLGGAMFELRFADPRAQDADGESNSPDAKGKLVTTAARPFREPARALEPALSDGVA